MTAGTRRKKGATATVPPPQVIGPSPFAGLRWLLLVVMAIGAMGTAGYFLWQHVGPQVAAGESYRLDPANIDVTPQPDWIRANVKSEVIRDGSLDRGLSILDEQLSQQIADAFALHPWVAKVQRVAKTYPARVRVDLEYRRPVVMVSNEGTSNLDLIPLDIEGIRLPNEDFSALEKRRFPRLGGIKDLPPVGQRPSDPRFAAGARLAALLGDSWEELELARIVPAELFVGANDPYPGDFELTTRGGTRIVWGPAPDCEPQGSIRAEEKLARLKHHLRKNSTPDQAANPQGLDVRQLPAVPASTDQL